MNLTPAQATIAKDKHRFRVVCVGRRGGKTTLAAEEIKGKALAKPSRIVYIAPTYQQARDIAWEYLKKELQPIIITANESRLEIRVRTIKGGESLIVLRGWESIETLRGQAFDFLVVDEVAMMRNFWINWQEVLRPTLTDTKGEVLFISTPKGFNHFYDLFNLQEKDSDYKSFHFTTYDNPFIPEEEIEKAKKEITDDRFAQEYLADFRKSSGLVYKEFERGRHTFEKLPQRQYLETIAGVDFGYTNPTCVLVAKRDYDNNFWITTEWYKTGKTNTEIIEYAKTLGANKFYPDPAEPDRIEEMRRAGLNVQEVNKDVEKGIDSVRELLKTFRLHISRECLNLIQEFETYSYPEKKEDKNEPEAPIKENDHCLDALRYMIFMQSPIRPEIAEMQKQQFIKNQSNQNSTR